MSNENVVSLFDRKPKKKIEKSSIPSLTLNRL